MTNLEKAEQFIKERPTDLVSLPQTAIRDFAIWLDEQENKKCKVFTEDCYNHPECMKTLEEDKKEKI